MSLMFRSLRPSKQQIQGQPNGFNKCNGIWRYKGYQVPADLVEYIPHAMDHYNQLTWSERLVAWCWMINTGSKEVG